MRVMKTAVFIYKTTQCSIPEDHSQHLYWHKNIKSHEVCYTHGIQESTVFKYTSVCMILRVNLVSSGLGELLVRLHLFC